MSADAGSALARAVRRLLREGVGGEVEIVSSRPQGGGSINRAAILELADGRRFFVKSNTDGGPDGRLPHLFERETEGLAALAAVGALRVPRGARAGGGDGEAPPFLLMEAIPTSSAPPDAAFFAEFGRRFARLHRESAAERFGFPHDNYIGATPQPNAWSDDWPSFWREHRLDHQMRLARSRGLSTPELDRLTDRLSDRLDALLEVPGEPPCLLHGDLWSGNFLVADDGRGGAEPALIDPAAYYGHREADFAMAQLFGGFAPSFYRAYEDEWPLPPGSAERMVVYRLYHLLNHLNLFGGGYRGQAIDELRKVV